MLDKSVPYLNILMHRRAGTPCPQPALPPDYRFISYVPGCENDWARIMEGVLEFDTAAQALAYFQEDYLPHSEELPRRCLFIEDPAGRRVATGSAWWSFTDGVRQPWIHWIAVEPQYQGRGLGKALVHGVLRRQVELDGDADIYLHTQSWSHRAVGIYERAGFKITDELLGGYKNDYEAALALLAQIRGRIR